MTTGPRHDPMWIAILNGQVDEVRRLLAAGAPASGACLNGETPLILAIRHRFPKVVQALIEAGAVVDERWGDRNRTPLMLAAYEGQLASVEALLDAGADATLLGDHGISPLAEAAWGGKGGAQLKIVQALLRAG